MRLLAEALRFLSTIPVPGKPPAGKAWIPAFYPWAGLLLGAIAAAGAWFSGIIFHAWGAAMLTIALRIVLTGGLHMDGLADLADGLGGGRNREKRLAIMSDSRLGSFGALALIVMVGLQLAVIAELLQLTVPGKPVEIIFPIIFAPILSRGIIPLIMKVFPSARPGGMGDRNRSSSNTAAAVTAFISVLIMAVFFYGLAGIAVTLGVVLLIFFIAGRISRQLGGLTGDVYGSLIETGDLLTLFGILLIFRFGLTTPGIWNLL